jgi:hypothetical protein
MLAVVVLTVLVTASLAMYLLPVLVGVARRVPDIGSIAVINILLGWTLAGWAVALALALRSVSPASTVVQILPPGQPWPGPLPPGQVPPASWPGRPAVPGPRREPPPLLLPPRPAGPWDPEVSWDTEDSLTAGGSWDPAGSDDTAERE